MKKSLTIAIGIQVAIMILIMIPPMFARAFGSEVLLEVQRVDPRALFRGDYVILDYPLLNDVDNGLTADQIARFEQAGREKKMIYVTLTQDRPAKLVSIDFKKPDLAPAQACIAARVGHWTEWDKDVSFPQISQYFVPEGEGKLLERNLESLLARVRTTNGCNAVLLGLEPKEMEN